MLSASHGKGKREEQNPKRRQERQSAAPKNKGRERRHPKERKRRGRNQRKAKIIGFAPDTSQPQSAPPGQALAMDLVTPERSKLPKETRLSDSEDERQERRKTEASASTAKKRRKDAPLPWP